MVAVLNRDLDSKSGRQYRRTNEPSVVPWNSVRLLIFPQSSLGDASFPTFIRIPVFFFSSINILSCAVELFSKVLGG